jgi:hypothetical protein
MKTICYIKIEPHEMKDLGWLADRYESAEILFENLQEHLIKIGEDKKVEFIQYKIRKSTVRRSWRNIPNDGGAKDAARRNIPCLGGNLEKKIRSMYHRAFTED